MTNPKTNSLLSPRTGGSHSRTPSTDSSGKRRSSFRKMYEKFRSKSPTPAAANFATSATLASNSVQQNIKASRSSPNMPIATTSSGVSTGQVALSSGIASKLAPATSTTNNKIPSAGSSSIGITATPTSTSRGNILPSLTFSATKGTGTTSLAPRSDIFPKDRIARVKIDINAPKIGHDFDSTGQLTICAGILNNISQAPSITSSSSPSPSTVSSNNHPTFDSLSASQKVWILEMEKNPIERQYVYQIMDRMVTKFISNELKDAESIHEIVFLGSVLNTKTYKRLLDFFLRRLDGSTLLDIDDLLGLVQLIQVAPKDYLVADDLNLILLCLRDRVKLSSQLDKNVLAQFVLVIAMILILLVACRTNGLSREKEYEPLLELLLELRGNDDPLVRYQADYACQSLLLVPEDEIPRQELCRHLIGLSSGLLRLSGIARLEFNGIAEGLPETIKGARGLFDFLKKELGSGGKERWFSAIRKAEDHIQKGDLSLLEDMVYDPYHGQDPKFLWGIIQLLGEVAADPSWDVTSREQAVKFLGEIFRSRSSINPKKDHDQDTSRWILTVLGHLSDLSASDSSDGANSVLTNLHAPVKAKSQALFDSLSLSSVKEFKYIHPLRISLPLPESSLLLKDVNDNPDLDHAIYKHRHKRQNEYTAQQPIFIQPMSKVSLLAPDNIPVALHTRVQAFLGGIAQVMLILGDSGAGKSTFNRHLENKLWEEYTPKESRIPLFINLPEIDRPQQDMIDKQLRIYQFSESHIKELKFQRRLLLICDGYDEAKLDDNLHTTNFLDTTKQQNVKMMISCRSTFVGQNHSDLFSPQTRDRYQDTITDQYTEAVIIPFSDDQIEDYVGRFVRDSEVHKPAEEGPLWSAGDYMDKLKSIPALLELVKNPFLLSLSLRALPRIVVGEADLAKVKVTRLTLYDSFIDHWCQKNRLRLRRTTLSGELKAASDLLINDDFAKSIVDFSTSLAAAVFHEHNGVPVVEYRPRRDRTTWKHEFFGLAPETILLLESSPLSRVHDQYRFLHQSLLEYFYSRYVFEAGTGNNAVSQNLEDISNHPLSKRHLVKESSILQFLAEYVQAYPGFKRRLDQIIERSKTDAQASQAASNAITILVRAGIRFHGADLKGIRIPGADLSYGQFDSAQLQGADLSNTTLNSIWLSQADLSDARMEGVVFGEWPYLQEDNQISCIVYSPNGKSCAIGLADGTINVYNASTLSKTCSLEGHGDRVTSIVYSPSGHQIASGSLDNTVRVWDAENGAARLVLTGHTNFVTGVAYSPSGHRIVSCSRDNTLRLWEAQTGAAGPVLTGHSGSVTTVVYSPSGRQIASGSGDKTVRLWDAESGAAGPVLTGHTELVSSVVYSLSGHQIASGSGDKTVRLWDAEAGTAGAVLSGHTGWVASVKYSPGGHQIASGSDDNTVRLWNAETGAAGPILIGHTHYVTSVVYSPSGHQIASVSVDNTLRLWDAETGAAGPVLTGHSHYVTSVVYSPSGHQIASGSWDNTVRLWEAQNNAAGPVLTGHSGNVTSVVYSPSGRQIASGSDDNTVRLWDAETGAAGLVLTGHTGIITNVVYSPSGHQIASGSGDKTVRLWDAETGAAGPVLTGRTHWVSSVVYSPSGHQIASGCGDKTLRLWDAETGAAGPVLVGHTANITSVVYSPGGHQIASSSHDNTVRLWDAENGAAGPVLIGHTAYVTRVAYSPSGHEIASSSDDNTVRLWDAETGAAGPVSTGHTHYVTSVVYSPSGHQIASGSGDETVRLWDAKTGAAGPVLTGHTGWVSSVVYSPSGHRIASGSYDNTVRLWDAHSAQCVAAINSFQGAVTCIAWREDSNGIHFVTGSHDNSVRVWNIIEDDDQHQVRLHWNTTQSGLFLSNTSIQNVQGLSRTNMRLLQQRGAVGSQELPMAHQAVGGLVSTMTAMIRGERTSKVVDFYYTVIDSCYGKGVLSRNCD